MSILTPGKRQRHKTGKGPVSPGGEDRAGFKSILFDPEGSVLFMERRFLLEGRKRNLSPSFFPSSGRAPPRTLLANYVKHDGRPATSIDSHRRMFYGAYYFRGEQSFNPAELLVSRFSERISRERKIRFYRDDLSRYASLYNGSQRRRRKLFSQRLRICPADA